MLITISAIIGQSSNLCLKNWKKLSVYALFLLFSSIILTLASLMAVYLDTYLPSSALASSLVVIALNIILGIFSLWVSLALLKSVGSLLKTGQTPGFKENFAATLPALWPAIYTSLLVGLIVIGGSLLFIIPGIIFTVWFLFTTIIIVLDDKKGVAALKYSRSLVKYRWWAIAFRWAIPLLVFAVGALFFQIILAKIFGLFISSPITLGAVYSSISAVLSSFIAPLMMANLIILYYSAQANPVVIPTPPVNTQK